MKRTLLLIPLILSVGVAAVAQTAKDEASIRRIMDDQAAAWNRGDIDAFMSGYWKSEKLQFVGGGVTRGWQATLDRYKQKYDTPEKMGKLSFSDVEFIRISKDAAFVVMSWSLQRAADNPHGKSTLLWRKFKEGWRIVVDHSS